jgi:hypothetical protein
MPTIYEVLGLTAGADPEQVKAAFHRLAKSSHPDVNSGDATAEGRFKQISQAYQILGDPERRAAYDLGLKHKRYGAGLRLRNVMATTAASFIITVGCGLYFLPSTPSAHEPSTSVATASPSPTDPQVKHEQATSPNVVPARQNVHLSAPPADERGTKMAGVVGRTHLQLDRQTQREQALHLYAKGMEHIGQGNVLAARGFFALAAKAGLKRSLSALAGTYDPVQLDKLKVLGMQPDVEAARSWYEKAGDLAVTAQLGMGEEWGLATMDKPSSTKTRDGISIATETSRD